MATPVGHPEKLRGGGGCSIKTRRIKSVPDHRIPPFLDPVSGWATFMNINCSLMVSDDDEEGDDAAATLPFRGTPPSCTTG